MTADYPVMLRLAGQRCVVVGGGPVATRKVRGLIVSGADILVVAPDIGAEIAALALEGKLHVQQRPFEPTDLDAATLIFAATDSRSVNAEIAEAARARGIIVNIADDPQSCDFTVPAVIRRNDVTLTVSTGGRSPAFARFLREQLQAWLTEARCDLLELIAEQRQILLSAGHSIGADRWQTAISDPTAIGALEDGNREAARLRLSEILTPER